MTARRACNMSSQPRINAILMKGMRTIIEDSHYLPLFNHILTNRTGVILDTPCRGNRTRLLQLLLRRMNNNRLVQKGLQVRYNGFSHYTTDKCTKKTNWII